MPIKHPNSTDEQATNTGDWRSEGWPVLSARGELSAKSC